MTDPVAEAAFEKWLEENPPGTCNVHTAFVAGRASVLRDAQPVWWCPVHMKADGASTIVHVLVDGPGSGTYCHVCGSEVALSGCGHRRLV